MGTPRTRVFFDAEEELKLAIQLAALKQDTSGSSLVANIVRQHLKDEITEAKKIIQQRKKTEKRD